MGAPVTYQSPRDKDFSDKMVADLWGAGELHNGAGEATGTREKGDSLVMFETGLQVVGDEGDQFSVLEKGRWNQQRAGATDLLDGRCGAAETQSAGKPAPGSRLRSQAKIWWVCIQRDANSHTCRNKRFLGKTHRFSELEKGPESRSEVPTVLPAGPKSQTPLPYTHSAGSLATWLLPDSVQPERLATPAALLCTPGSRAREGRRGTILLQRPGEPRRQAPWEWGVEGGAGTPVS